MSIYRLAKDNNAFVEYCHDSFFVENQNMCEILLQGRCVRGLYPLSMASSSSTG
jgi:hypothetical protein